MFFEDVNLKIKKYEIYFVIFFKCSNVYYVINTYSISMKKIKDSQNANKPFKYSIKN